MRTQQYSWTIVIVAMIAIFGVHAVPILPGQIYVSALGAGDLNLLHIVNAMNETIYRGYLSNGTSGVNPLLVTPGVNGPFNGEILSVFVNGYYQGNIKFRQATLDSLRLNLSTPSCGNGACEANESCLYCAADCRCQRTDVRTLTGNFAYLRLPNETSMGIFLTNRSIDLDIYGKRVAAIQMNENFTDLSGLKVSYGQRERNKSYVIMNQEGQKTIYLDRTTNGTQVCVKDAYVDDISEVSRRCDNAAEYRLVCDGRMNFGMNCSMNETQYVISGLTHSAVTEIDQSDLEYVPPVTKKKKKSAYVPPDYTNDYISPGVNKTINISGIAGANISTSRCISNWNCSTYFPDPCPSSGYQTRKCWDKNHCARPVMPALRRECKPGKSDVRNVTKIVAQPAPVEKALPSAPVQKIALPAPIKEPALPSEPAEEPIIETAPQIEVTSQEETPGSAFDWTLVIGIGAFAFILVIILLYWAKGARPSEKEKYVSDAMTFIKNSRQIGYSDTQIRDSLRKGEWPETYVREAFKRLK